LAFGSASDGTGEGIPTENPAMTSTGLEFVSALIGTCNKQEEGKASVSPAMTMMWAGP
jgi:hypothetical protein